MGHVPVNIPVPLSMRDGIVELVFVFFFAFYHGSHQHEYSSFMQKPKTNNRPNPSNSGLKHAHSKVA